MAKKARQRISYVLERADKQLGGHIKGVNGLAIDRDRSILYSGGRDGILCSWDLNLDLSDKSSSSTSDSVPDASKPPEATKFRSQYLAHTNWICDIALVQNNEAVVTASQDQLIKLWRPHSSEDKEPVKIGQHTDYAKCVTSPGHHATWVATGGLDRKVFFWDLNGGGETMTIDTVAEEQPEKGSIYALNATENLLAYGGVEKIVHLWDPRSSKRITKFRGHTDNIRSILLSADGDTVMTSSSDHTVKIWSVTAGRCMHTLTMHNDSVFSTYSEDPTLGVFYSADRSGLVVKTDIRGGDVDEGLSLAVAHEHDMVFKCIAAGDYIWTATQRSSINRWHNVDTGPSLQLPEALRQYRPSSSSSVPVTTSASDKAKKDIPVKSVLRISNTATFPPPESPEIDPKTGEPIEDEIEPLQHAAQETIEGQFGLVKHRLLADKRRVLTLDTAGDVLLWDLIQCKPIRSFGKKHLDDIEPLINTLENVSPWCSVDTSSGSLTVILEPFNCFDAELYADELELDEPIEFRDDQRINLGKWILRYLFQHLIDEEIRRDELHRKSLNETVEQRLAASKGKPSPTIQIPTTPRWEEAIESPTTPRPNGSQQVPMTPGGMGIGLATPILPGVREEDPFDKKQPQDKDDYFSNDITSAAGNNQIVKSATTPAVAESGDKAKSDDGKDREKEKDKDKEGKAPGTPFGKKFRMSFSTKKLRSGSATVAEKPAVIDEKAAESESSSNHGPEKEFDDNFLGVVQRIQDEYEKQLSESPENLVETKITPSLPNETPVLHIPLETKIMIQEETAGGNAELYRGTVRSVGLDADRIEQCAPLWLGEVLLLNTIPHKEPVKVSFILHPFPKSGLPALASADGNNRLNANKMLRVKKILAYVAERIEPSKAESEHVPEESSEQESEQASGEKVERGSQQEAETLKPDEYLELYCNDQLLPISMTLATLRAYIWKNANDVVLHYKANGRKDILPAPSSAVPDAEKAVAAEETEGEGVAT